MEENIKSQGKIYRIKKLLKRRPITVFLVFLAVLMGAIVIGNMIRSPKASEDQAQKESSKKVETYSFDGNPFISVQAKINKKNIIQLVSQKTGIVSFVYVIEGQKTYRGKTVAYVSDTPFGANASSVAVEIAKKQEEASDDNLERQKKIFKKQKEIIEHTSTPTNNDERQAYIDKKQVSINKENAKLADKVSDLSLEQAQIIASLAKVSAPANGIIERVFVKPGEFVSAGTPIALFRSDSGDVLAEAQVSADIASLFSTSAESRALIGGKNVEIQPIYISSEATDGYLYSIIFRIPDEHAGSVANDSFIQIELPLEKSASEKDFHPLVSLDAIQITQDKNFVFVIEEGMAKNREVVIGKIFGKFAEIVSGLGKEDEVIMSRNVFDGDAVEPIQ